MVTNVTRLINCPWVLVGLALVTGCDHGASSLESSGGSVKSTTGSTPPLDCPSDCGTACQGDATELFGRDSIPEFDFTLADGAWEELLNNARDEAYTTACLSLDGRALGKVGLRFKGSYGTLYGCFDDNDQLTCPKLSMKAKFDFADESLRLFGLKRLNLHSMLHDPSKLKERLAYDLYREMGIVAPRSAWASVKVNGESHGLYSMVEEIDGRFTADHFPEDGQGDLYKEAWPNQNPLDYFAERLKTNEDTGTHEAILEFANALATAEPGELHDVLAEHMDVDQVGRYMAVDDAIVNVDGLTAFYTSDDGFWIGNHNYYLYHEPGVNQFRLIPWDTDSTFLLWADWSRVPHWSSAAGDCSKHYYVWSGDIPVIAPNCDRLLQAIAHDLTPYRVAIDELLSGPFSETSINAAIDRHAAFVQVAVENDGGGPSLASWQDEIAFLKENMGILRLRLESLRDGLPLDPFGLSTREVNDFENVSSVGLVLGSTLYANDTTSVSQLINTKSPLGGSQDFRLDFEFRNDFRAWEQWIAYEALLTEGQQDLSALTGIRLTAKADGPRILRIELGSPENSAADEGIRRGWELELSAEPQRFELALSEAAVQSWAIDQGRDPGDDLGAILETVNGLVFKPNCMGQDPDGFLPEGTTDVGFVELDDLEFYGQ